MLLTVFCHCLQSSINIYHTNDCFSNNLNIGGEELFSGSYNHRFLEASDRDVNVKQFGKCTNYFPKIQTFYREFFWPYITNLYYACALTRGPAVSRRPESYNSDFKP